MFESFHPKHGNKATTTQELQSVKSTVKNVIEEKGQYK